MFGICVFLALASNEVPCLIFPSSPSFTSLLIMSSIIPSETKSEMQPQPKPAVNMQIMPCDRSSGCRATNAPCRRDEMKMQDRECECARCWRRDTQKERSRKAWRAAIAVVSSLLVMAIFAFFSFSDDAFDIFGMGASASETGSGFSKRQSTITGGRTTQGPFIRNKRSCIFEFLILDCRTEVVLWRSISHRSYSRVLRGVVPDGNAQRMVLQRCVLPLRRCVKWNFLKIVVLQAASRIPFVSLATCVHAAAVSVCAFTD